MTAAASPIAGLSKSPIAKAWAASRLGRELACLMGVARALRATTHIGRNPTRIFPRVMTELAARHGARVALISDHGTLTYAGLEARANSYARWARENGISKGDVVALIMPNRPDYLAFWIGVTRIGGVVALVNANLCGSALAHAVAVAGASHVVVAAELEETYAAAAKLVPLLPSPAVWLHGAGRRNWPRVDAAADRLSGEPLEDLPVLTVEDRALLIYTSGTTGMPKAANINHFRVMSITHGFCGAMAIRPSDRMYDCLPMYHTSGGLIAACAPLVAGASVVIRDRFQASRFWEDVARTGCTLVEYIGELCRYLVHTAPCAAEQRHKLRLICGNGLRPDVWPAFEQRFRVPKILEWYAATEGNVVLFNFDGTPGSVGRIAWWMKRRFPVKVAAYDVEAGDAVRGPDGRCVECAPGEVGEPVGMILDCPSKPAARFEGYADAQATSRKVLADAFSPGDRWFRSGDLMRRDARGYFYFVDRIGDTFRWRGENVSTTEVAEAIGVFPGVAEATVYGVAVDGYDGRAGMAMVVPDGEPGDLDLAGLHAHVAAALPVYARPLFLRVGRSIAHTGTLKQRKVELAAEGWGPAACGDSVWLAHPAEKRYVALDAGLAADIGGKRLRL
jgi:fatty-acyl-CoA synthase